VSTESAVSNGLLTQRIGTYCRTTCIDRIVDTFISSTGNSRKQVISLGAGSDTRFFRLCHKRQKLDLVYHELDFVENTSRKIRRLRGAEFVAASRKLASFDPVGEDVAVSPDGTGLVSPSYLIHPQDLRQLRNNASALEGVDITIPTLVLSECCLVYLPPHDADAVLQYFADLFPQSTPLSIAIYEPIRPYDSFGRTMISNLASRGLQLQTLERYHDLEQQKSRLRNFGFVSTDQQQAGAGCKASDISTIWKRWTSPEEKERIEGLEWMDEVEEFELLARHYCISWGWRGFDRVGREWEQLSGS
jgi:[phosphatase 2A protein]-leucine-carboxy methyltransferase